VLLGDTLPPAEMLLSKSLECDNGSAFIAGELGAPCETWEVELLWSPPRTPRYNGTVESGMRCLKERTEHTWLSAGHPQGVGGRTSKWRSDPRTTYPRSQRLTPERAGEVFGRRRSITEEERAAFRARLVGKHAAERRLRGIGDDEVLRRHQEASKLRRCRWHERIEIARNLHPRCESPLPHWCAQ